MSVLRITKQRYVLCDIITRAEGIELAPRRGGLHPESATYFCNRIKVGRSLYKGQNQRIVHKTGLIWKKIRRQKDFLKYPVK
jgi:hypothetical protein